MNKATFRMFFIIFTLGLTNQVLAQESGFPAGEEENTTESPGYEEEWNVREGGMILPENQISTETEKKADNTSTVLSNKITAPNTGKIENTATPVKETTSKTIKQNEDDESVLSFNLLYYLIQKFKFDTVE